MKTKLIVLLALTFVVSCSNKKQSRVHIITTVNSSPDTAKPVIITSLKTEAYPAIFQAAFSIDTKVHQDDETYNFTMLDIGKLKIMCGKLIACDPIVMKDATPFTQQFPIGEYPVQLALAKTQDDERVAFSRVVFSDEAISKWEFALQKGQKPIPLKDSSCYCYGVDAGTGIFIDSISNIIFNKTDHLEWEKAFFVKAGKYENKGYIHAFDGHNLAAFSTGYGDGCYATYIGFDNKGRVCQLLTDFGLVEWWKLDEKK